MKLFNEFLNRMGYTSNKDLPDYYKHKDCGKKIRMGPGCNEGMEGEIVTAYSPTGACGIIFNDSPGRIELFEQRDFEILKEQEKENES